MATQPFPLLRDGVSIAPALINGVDPTQLTTTGSQEISVTFNDEDALFESTLGYVATDSNGEIIETGIVFANTDGPDRLTGINQPGDTVSLGTFDDETQVGFFFIQKGAQLGIDYGAGSIRIENGADAPGSLLGTVPPIVVFDGNDGSEVEITNPIFFTIDTLPNLPLNNPLNDGGNTQFISGINQDGDLQIGVEDRTLSLSDGDFNDFTFSVEFDDATQPSGSLDVFASSTGRVLLNVGPDGFLDSGQQLGTSFDGFSTVVLGDLDGDGDLDAVTTAVGSAPGDNGRAFLNDGNGFFVDSGQVLAGNADGVTLGDIDGDGDLDAMFANVQGSEFDQETNSLFLNNGSGTLTRSEIAFPPSNPVNPDDREQSADFTASIELGDLDSDGDLDAIFANVFALDQVLLNDGTGNFNEAPRTGGIRTSDVALGDMDGDGDLDAVFAGADNLVMLNDGAAGFSQGAGFLGGLISGSAVELGDLDNDGDLDAVLASSSDGDQLFLNDGTGALFFEDILSPEGSDDVVFGDLDGDADLDVVLVNELFGSPEPNTALLNDGNANFVDSGFFLSSGNIALGDLDGGITVV